MKTKEEGRSQEAVEQSSLETVIVIRVVFLLMLFSAAYVDA